MNENDSKLLRLAIDVARQARDNGNHPFGAVLTDDQHNVILQAENTVVTERDCTGHAETNLMRRASALFDAEFLATCTIYSSAEPCPMCTGAIFWANVRRVVYGLSAAGLYEIIGDKTDEILHVPCRDLLKKGNKSIEVVGPLLEEEARKVHQDFWR